MTSTKKPALNLCSIGQLKKTPCSITDVNHPLHLVTGNNQPLNVHLKVKRDFDKLSRFLIRKRSGCYDFKSICLAHEDMYLKNYVSQQLVCCNPLGYHKEEKERIYKNRKYDILRLITVQNYMACKKLEFADKMVPGNKICSKCFKKCAAKMEKNVSCEISSSSDEDNEEDYLYSLALSYR